MKTMMRINLTLLLIAFLGFIVPGLEAATINVNCNKGESVQIALDSLTGPATIVVKGTCPENIVIKKDDVNIEGGTFIGPTINQDTIQVKGARRVVIKGATVGGAKDGVAAYQGASLNVESSKIQDNAGAGVVANFGSLVIVDSCTVQNNGGDGVLATANSSLLLMNSTITDNKGTGVNVYKGSSARIGVNFQDEPRPNIIQNNEVNGVKVYGASQALISNNTIKNNTAYGVFVLGSSARLTNNTVKFNNIGLVVTIAGSARIGTNHDGSPGEGNIIKENLGEGISISNSGSAQLANNTIKANGLSNAKPGIGIYRASGHLFGGNTIQGNGTHGIQVNQGTLLQGRAPWAWITTPDVIKANGLSGISAWNSASLDIQYAEITNNAQNGIALGLRSTLRIYDSTISGHLNASYHGVAVYDGSAAAFNHPAGTNPASITANEGWGVFCGGGEASYLGDTTGVSGNGSGEVSCTGF